MIVLLFYFVWPQCCLFVNLLILVTPLVSSNSSQHKISTQLVSISSFTHPSDRGNSIRFWISCLGPLVSMHPELYIIRVSNRLIMNVPDEGYSRYESCALDYISTFSSIYHYNLSMFVLFRQSGLQYNYKTMLLFLDLYTSSSKGINKKIYYK